MKLSHFFIDRPVFASVIAVLITLMGALALPTLPLAQYPAIAPPTVQITANYPGASAEVLADTVATPIEEQLTGIDNMLYMSSQATGDGHLSITVTFKVGADLDIAQVQVENRLAAAEPQLPQVVRDVGVVVRKSNPDVLIAVHVLATGSLTQQYAANYVTLHIRDELLRLPGVGDLYIRGARDYSMRVWIDPDRAAARKLTVEEIVDALRSHNMQIAAGSIGAPPFGQTRPAFQLNIDATGRLTSPDEFQKIIIKRDEDGRITRIEDIARVELGAQDYSTGSYLDENEAVFVAVLQQSNSNALATAKLVKAKMAELKKSFPPELNYRIVYNPTEYVQASIDKVIETLFIAIVLVVLVVLAFLQTWRAALIPIIAIPVSLIGTFAVMATFGYSLNNLTLFGLVLAIGIVVDDAIVVVENIERHLRAGISPREAAHMTMDEVGGALIAIALVLTGVFVPTAFISGISGLFYQQFALTIASATVISLLVSLTLSPAMAALIMRPHAALPLGEEKSWRRPFVSFADRFNASFAWLSDRYAAMVRRLMRMVAVMLVVYAGLLAVTAWRLDATPRGFIPMQDQGALLLAVTLPPGSSLQRTDEVTRQLIPILNSVPGKKASSIAVGVDPTTSTTASNGIQIYMVLDSFESRLSKRQTVDFVKSEVAKRTAGLAGAQVRAIQLPPVRGIGNGGGFKMIVEDRSGGDFKALQAVTDRLVAAAAKDKAFSTVFTTFNTNTPRIRVDIDRDKAEVLGVRNEQVFNVLQTYLGSTFVNQFNYLGRTFQVLAQADSGFRQDESQIAQLKTRSASGEMTPLGSVVSISRETAPYRVQHYNGHSAAEVQGEPAPGYSSGQAMAALEKLADEILPAGYAYEWTELAFQQKAAGDTGGLVFLLSVAFVFLMLAALYESVTLPLSVILIVPMCLFAALLGVTLRGLDNNILTQVGFVVLIGLAAKNAILIVEFARQGEIEHGLDRVSAAAEAGRTRLRPILMTSLAFILGVAPLAFASGAGSEMRVALGTAVMYGMIGVTAFGLIFTPIFYVLCRKLSDRLPKPPPRRPSVPTTSGSPHDAESEPQA